MKYGIESNNIDIKPVQINRIFGRRKSCLYDILATLSKYNNIEYRYAFAHEFNFQFNYSMFENTALIGKSIEQKYSDGFDLFEKYTGYHLTYCYITDFNEEVKFIKEMLSIKQPAIIHFDAFYLPWDPFFGKIHNNHAVLVVGFEEEKSSVYITDPYFNIKKMKISLDTIQKASKFFIYFKNTEKISNLSSNKDLLLEYIHNDCFISYPSKIFQNLIFLANQFKFNFIAKKEFSFNSILDQNDIFINISDIILRIGLFYISIDFIYSKDESPYLQDVLEQLKKIISAWNEILSLIAKEYFNNNDNSFIITQNIIIMANYYESVLRNIKFYINTEDRKINNINNNNKVLKDFSMDKVLCLKLERFYNNNGFLQPDCNGNADLTGMREAFCYDENISGKNVFDSTYKFLFPKIEKNRNNNISCNGQSILVPIDFYSNGLILYCSVWGNYYDKITLEYNNGQREESYLWYTDITSDSSNKTSIVWSGKTGYFDNGKINIIAPSASIFFISFKIVPDTKLRKIYLCKCSNIHIFSISLIRK
jgi:hypothetical protein